ncbi:LLM class F420-dependent oxidoreductase [Mycobacterium parmense]|uniref:LLM class F420-dependent oxidoreductase n=1 Tax=Mycobacterium parmense TaxID=185642 RepID=A0A7I7YR86_9MYCO|nr:LLM class F420-dependent oxidoreductase [Mycobacterium parmense]MCV7348770.1 LLM class F420-dependent oxidoreductase [Mycobacterium parmense]ORW49640.1 LLM class F420-dependent oxidoreductase [Mycobacterium parmense]BBZ44280.1 LLM class F420-dependent oxidoreductase [Mycobacterium parmense]
MHFRIFADPSNGASYDDLSQSARLAEEFGYGGYFLSDHYLPFAGDGGPGPTDVWTTLAGLARDTSRIRLGSLVTSVTFRHPGPLAIIVAQVDAMSRGRIDFGLGAGYFEPEHAAYGIPFPPVAERFDRLGEALELITGLWKTPAGQRYSFDGKCYRLVDSPALPKPHQQPGPPIILGGTGKRRTPALAARFADEFNLQTSRRRAPSDHRRSELGSEDVAAQIHLVRSAAEAIGRDPSEIAFSMSALVGAGRTGEEVAAALDPGNFGSQAFDGTVLSGSAAQIVDQLGPYAQLGISRVYVRAPSSMAGSARNFELIAAEVLPQLASL